MRKVVLIGDSIRWGYQPIVGRSLIGVAGVCGPIENGGSSSYVLSHLNQWVFSMDPDVVHINCGLHDIMMEEGSSEVAIPIQEYSSNVRQILQEILTKTQATVIWANTTPVNQVWQPQNKPLMLFENDDVVAYNKAAMAIANEMGVTVNDLYTVVMEAGRDRLMLDEGVHFTEEGYQILGKAVTRHVGRFFYK